MTTINTGSRHETTDDMELRRRAKKGMKDAHQIRAEFLAESAQAVASWVQGMTRTIVNLIDRHSKTSSGSFSSRRPV